MKFISLVIGFLSCMTSFSQVEPLASKVYSIDTSNTVSNDNGNTKKVFKGSGSILSFHEVTAITLQEGKSMSYKADTVFERFFIISKGTVKVKLHDSAFTIDRGSVVLVLPGDKVRFENEGDKAVHFYEMTYRSIAPPDNERGRKGGGSFVLDWNTIAFRAHDKGGVRQYFDRPTHMFSRFDIHVTTLNTGFKSHDPHTHKNEEIILMLEGNGEMQIGAEHQKANPGDVVLLGSMVLHNITNVGKTPCLYFAIQWN